MKRHPAFQDLSRDHYTALNRSLQLVRAAEGHPGAMLTFDQAVAAFRALWTRGGLHAHFLEEETDLLPVLQARGGAALAQRMRQEHDDLRSRFDALAPAGGARVTPDKQAAAAAAKALTAHARWEEDVVFPWLQETLAEPDLQALHEKSRGFRAANGLPVNPPRP